MASSSVCHKQQQRASASRDIELLRAGVDDGAIVGQCCSSFCTSTACGEGAGCVRLERIPAAWSAKVSVSCERTQPTATEGKEARDANAHWWCLQRRCWECSACRERGLALPTVLAAAVIRSGTFCVRSGRRSSSHRGQPGEVFSRSRPAGSARVRR